MTPIYDKIFYDHKLYSELSDSTAKREIERLADKLKHLETEIANSPEGTITVMKSGNIFTDSFAPELSSKSSELINGD